MKLARQSGSRGEGLAIWIILLAIVAGAVWFAYSSHADAERRALSFATEVTQKVAVDYDAGYLQVKLAAGATGKNLPSWRDRLLYHLRSFGPLSKPIETKGDVQFTSYFFDPRGSFRSELVYPTHTAYLDLLISRGMNAWQVDDINLVWTPPPTPTPSASPVMAASPTPTPTPRRKRG